MPADCMQLSVVHHSIVKTELLYCITAQKWAKRNAFTVETLLLITAVNASCVHVHMYSKGGRRLFSHVVLYHTGGCS